jgi:KaiC/GvpD/RAD55 family RecA-like ATPase
VFELNVLKSFLSRDSYTVYRNYVKLDDFTKEMRPVMAALDLWYQNNTVDCTVDDLCNLFFSTHVDNKDFYREVFQGLAARQPLESTKTLLEGFRRQRMMEDLSAAAYEASTGRKTAEHVFRLAEALKAPVVEDQPEFVTDDLASIVETTVTKPGLKWRLNTLNRMFGSLRKGDFGFIFARPETGKTTFLASEITYMAEQLSEDSGPILWYNLEEEGNKVKFRCFQAALGKTKAEILADIPKAQADYLKLTKGKIKIFDDATTTANTIERHCEAFKPALVVIDQLDKVHGYKNDREDLRLGQIYVWARELAKRFCPVVGVCQADASAEGREFLTMAEVSNSKTSKAAEADWILGIGASHEPGNEGIRGLAAPKNKLLGDDETDPAFSHGKRKVLIRPQIQRYIDIG